MVIISFVYLKAHSCPIIRIRQKAGGQRTILDCGPTEEQTQANRSFQLCLFLLFIATNYMNWLRREIEFPLYCTLVIIDTIGFKSLMGKRQDRLIQNRNQSIELHMS